MLSLAFSPGAGVLCNSGTRKGAGVLRTLCLSKAAGSREKAGSQSVVRFKRSRSRLRAMIRGGKVVFRVSVRLGGGDPGKVTVSGMPVHHTDRLFNVIRFIFFSPRSLGVVGRNPTKEEEFVSLRLSRLSGVCLGGLSGCGHVVGRHGSLLGSVCNSGRRRLLRALSV